jgi:hypothetical protein
LPDVDASFEAAWAMRIEDWLTYVKAQFGSHYALIPNIGSWVTTRDSTGYSAANGGMVDGFAEWDANTPFDLAGWQFQMNRILGLARLSITLGPARSRFCSSIGLGRRQRPEFGFCYAKIPCMDRLLCPVMRFDRDCSLR